MISKYAKIAFGITLIWNISNAAALTINFDYQYDTGGFFTDTVRRDILTAAGNRITSRINDNLSAITSKGSNQFNPVFNSPDGSGRTSISSASIGENILTIFVGAQNFPGSSVGLGGPGGFSASGSPDFFKTISNRGQPGVTLGPDANEFTPWGGSISFDNNNNWFFDDNIDTIENFTGTDFYSVALHELGHVFGIGTSDAWSNLIVNGKFTGLTSSALFGENITVDADNSHWQEGILFNSLETSMDPSNINGTRQDFTELDFAALKDIGWEVTPVPLPPALFLFISGILGLIITGKRKYAQGYLS